MSFQQQINQVLYTGTIAKGLYARSPAGEAKRLTKAYEQAESNRKDWEEPLPGEESLAEKFTEQQAERARKIYELKPTSENLARAKEEAQALASLTEGYTKKTNQKEGFKERESILLNQYGEKMEVKENGNK